MHYYADYEALEFNSQSAKTEGIFPYYLDVDYSESALCPIFLSCCNHKGNLVQSQNPYDTNISFISLMNTLIFRTKKSKDLFIWFHNVQYDFRIIVHELFYNNFIHIVDSKEITYYGPARYKEEYEKTFSLIGTGLSKYIGANIYYRDYCIHIRDTMSILNSSQDKILKEFNFNRKIPVDWDKINIKNLKQNIELIKDRCEYDVQSLSKAIEQFKKEFKERFEASGNTAAGISLDALKYYLLLKKKTQCGQEFNKEEIFNEYYPQLTQKQKELSQGCYHGGICTIDKEKAGKDLYNIQMVDINSSYPYAMTKELPYGDGVTLSNFCDSGYNEYVVFISFDYRGNIPFQRCHSENKARRILGIEELPEEKTYSRSQFPEKFDGYLCINSIDLGTLVKYAEVKTLEFLQGINYNVNTALRDFIVPIYRKRKESQDVQKLAIKLILNSLYGKFAQDLSGKVFLYDSMDDYVKLDAIDNNTYYKPLASAVTAYARQRWVEMVYLLGKDFIYGDTDSVYFENVERCNRIIQSNNLLHDNELGKWSFDRDYGKVISKARFLSKKNYILQLENELKVVCVGLSKKYHHLINFDNFYLDSQIFDIQKMVNIYGGKAMRRTQFKIRERYI